MDHVVVVGSSLAGLRAVETLRSARFGGRITVIGDEQHRPYDRPPLSKKFLAGEWDPDRIALRKPNDLDALGIDWRLGVAATGLDVANRQVHLGSGPGVSFDGLVVATGAQARRLPGPLDHPGLHVLRTLSDAVQLRAALAGGGARVVIVGAGFIGLEVAATAVGLGNQVTVLEGLPAPLVRGLGADLGSLIGEIHVEHGVELRCGVALDALDPGGATLTGGERVPADAVVVGVGASPVTGWLESSGLEVRDGLVCDATLNAGVPGVYAAGDVCRWYHELYGEEMRIEHWTNAAEQGAHAATNLLAAARGEAGAPYTAVPFVWSDQYDRRIQFLGRSVAHDEVRVVAGSAEERKLIALYRQGDRLQGVLGLNSPRLLMPYRSLLAQRASWEDALEHAAAAAS